MPPDDDLIEIAVDDLALGPHDGEGLVDKKPEARKAAPKQEAAPAIDPNVLENLKRQNFESEAARERAEAAAAEARARAEKAETQAGKSTEFGWRAHWAKVNSDLAKVNSDADNIKSALGSTQTAITNDTAALQAASEAGDHAAIARLNAQIARNSAYLTRLEEGQAGIGSAVAEAEAEIERAKREYAAYAADNQPAKREEEPAAKETKKQPATPEEFIATSPVATRSWLKENKNFAVMGSREQKKLDVFAAEWLLDHDDDRATLNTQAFVDALDAKFNPKKEQVEEPEAVAEEEEVVEEQPTKAQPRKAATAAPVSRASTPSQSSGSLGKIVLTRSQADIAPQLYDKYEDFDPEVKAKFPNGWSETAARFQYHQHLQMAKKEKGHRFTS